MAMVERTALVRRPSPRLAEGIVTHIDRQPVDVALAARQHEAYVAALEAAGWHVRWLPPADDLPDGVFVEDTVVVCDDLAVLARPGMPERRPGGRLDGGDDRRAGAGDGAHRGRGHPRRRRRAAGRHTPSTPGARPVRTKTRSASWRGCSRTRGRRVVPVTLDDCLHLKSAMTALPDGSLIGIPELRRHVGAALPRRRAGADRRAHRRAGREAGARRRLRAAYGRPSRRRGVRGDAWSTSASSRRSRAASPA